MDFPAPVPHPRNLENRSKSAGLPGIETTALPDLSREGNVVPVLWAAGGIARKTGKPGVTCELVLRRHSCQQLSRRHPDLGNSLLGLGLCVTDS